MQIYDLQGQLVKTLLNGKQQAGIHSLQWDARDEAGARVASGIYICRMQAGKEVLSRKLILAK